MTIPSLAFTLRHAALVALAASVAPVTACGGTVEGLGTSSGSSSSSGGSSGNPTDGGANGCTVKGESPIGSRCGATFDLNGLAESCGVPADGGGSLTTAECQRLCPPNRAASCFVSNQTRAEDGGITTVGTLQCDLGPCGNGRKPEGLARATFEGPGAVARYLAQAAHLEAAAVGAFAILARELAAHGAPRRLQARARAAAKDEVRHARAMTALAKRAGATPPRAVIAKHAVRPLEEIALENAAEGCIRETFGATVAWIQADRARDPRVRGAMRRIAADEARHAELSWDVARWLDTKLCPAARRRVHGARIAALEALRAEMSRDPHAELAREVGLPSAAEARRALDALQPVLAA
jgi:hypothetical protein